jgi:hypothetical protein
MNIEEEDSGIIVEVPPAELPTPLFIHIDDGYYEMHIDNSTKELFESCARAAEYYTRWRREGVGERGSLFRGGVIHHCLAIRRLMHLQHKSQKEWEAEQMAYIINAYEGKDFGFDEWRTAEHAINTILAYNQQWPIDLEPFTVLQESIEQPFKICLGDAEIRQKITTNQGTFYVEGVRIYWTGRMDCRIDYGSPLVMESKTTSILGTNFWDNFQLDSQTLGYAWSAKKLGYPVEGVYVDALAGRKPTKTGVPYEFQRQRFFYEQSQLNEWERDTFTLVTDFLEHLCRDYFPKSPKWCFGKYGRCQYWNVCVQEPEKRMAQINGDLYKPVTWSPLNPPTK